jgi:hypothetical protein
MDARDAALVNAARVRHARCRYPGRPVDQIGDELMLRFPDSVLVVSCGLRIDDLRRAAAIPRRADGAQNGALLHREGD